MKLNPLKWFSKARTREEELSDTAAEMTVKWVLPQLAACGFSKADINFSGPAGSTEVVAYVCGYARAVHGYLEASSGIQLNDGTIMLGSLHGVYISDTFEAACLAFDRVNRAVSTDTDNVRKGLALGLEDFESVATTKPYQIPGLIQILGLNR